MIATSGLKNKILWKSNCSSALQRSRDFESCFFPLWTISRQLLSTREDRNETISRKSSKRIYDPFVQRRLRWPLCFLEKKTKKQKKINKVLRASRNTPETSTLKLLLSLLRESLIALLQTIRFFTSEINWDWPMEQPLRKFTFFLRHFLKIRG